MELPEKKTLQHNELIKSIFAVYNPEDKAKYTSLFLSGFSTNKPVWRSGLATFAVMQSFPRHDFTLRQGQELTRISPCEVCSCFMEMNNRKDFIIDCFYEVGGLVGFGLQNYYCYLSETNKLDRVAPKKEDFRIFSEIINILLEARPGDTVKKTIQSGIGKIQGFKSNTEQRQTWKH